MLDNIEQNDDIHMTDAPQVRGICHSRQDIQAGAAAVLGGLGGELDSGHVEMTRRLPQEEAVGAAQLQQLPATAITADEVHAAREFAAQDRLGAEVVGVAVGMAAGEIVPGVVGGGIEFGRFRATEAAIPALQECRSRCA